MNAPRVFNTSDEEWYECTRVFNTSKWTCVLNTSDDIVALV